MQNNVSRCWSSCNAIYSVACWEEQIFWSRAMTILWTVLLLLLQTTYTRTNERKECLKNVGKLQFSLLSHCNFKFKLLSNVVNGKSAFERRNTRLLYTQFPSSLWLVCIMYYLCFAYLDRNREPGNNDCSYKTTKGIYSNFLSFVQCSLSSCYYTMKIRLFPYIYF